MPRQLFQTSISVTIEGRPERCCNHHQSVPSYPGSFSFADYMVQQHQHSISISSSRSSGAALLSVAAVAFFPAPQVDKTGRESLPGAYKRGPQGPGEEKQSGAAPQPHRSYRTFRFTFTAGCTATWARCLKLRAY